MCSSQNYRMLEVKRDLWRSSGQHRLLKQDHLQPISQDHVQMAFEYLQGWRHHNFFGQPLPVLGHPHSSTVFPDVQKEPLVFQFVPVASCRLIGHHWKEPGSIFFAPSLQVFI